MTDPVSADTSLQPDYFDRVYAAKADPWDFETSAYEAAKYDATLQALPADRYGRALEIGCSIGVLTRRLAERCDHLLAVDVSEAALDAARRRCADRPQVEFARMQIPDVYPDARFDLVLVSEVGYYWSRPDLRRALDAIVSSLEPEGSLVLVHWTAPVHDYPLRGDDVHDEAFAMAGPGGPLRHTSGSRHERYRIDAFTRR